MYDQMCNSDREKNCLLIITHRGLYRNLRIPFGPKISPSFFHILMEGTFKQNILMGWVKFYIDDILVHSNPNEEHIQLKREGSGYAV